MSQFENKDDFYKSELSVNCKNKGNQFFQEQQAIECYSKAIQLYNKNPIFYANRAEVYLRIINYDQCIQDCDNAIQLDSKNKKCYFRRFKAYEQKAFRCSQIKEKIKFLENAINDLEYFNQLQSNQDQQQVEKLQQLIEINNDLQNQLKLENNIQNIDQGGFQMIEKQILQIKAQDINSTQKFNEINLLILQINNCLLTNQIDKLEVYKLYCLFHLFKMDIKFEQQLMKQLKNPLIATHIGEKKVRRINNEILNILSQQQHEQELDQQFDKFEEQFNQKNDLQHNIHLYSKFQPSENQQSSPQKQQANGLDIDYDLKKKLVKLLLKNELTNQQIMYIIEQQDNIKQELIEKELSQQFIVNIIKTINEQLNQYTNIIFRENFEIFKSFFELLIQNPSYKQALRFLLKREKIELNKCLMELNLN